MFNKSLLLVVALSIAACSIQAKTAASEDKIAGKYLNCYALDSKLKQQCIEDLYFEAEKLGFKQFLNNLNLPCERINDGPEFIEEKQAYLVKCQPNHQYLMRFTYETQEWKLIKEK